MCVLKTAVELWNLGEDIIFPAEKSFSVPCAIGLSWIATLCSPFSLVSLSAAHYLPGTDFVYVGDEAGTLHVVNFTKPLSVGMYKVSAADTGGYEITAHMWHSLELCFIYIYI